VSQAGARRVVYDSDTGGRVEYCRRCGEPKAHCRCHDNATADFPGRRDGYVRLAREKAGRGGKVVTVVTGLPGDAAALAQLAQELRRLCGAGGTVKGAAIELQGEHRMRLEKYLKEKGYTVKIAGG
jgi:translation initiation factor 1